MSVMMGGSLFLNSAGYQISRSVRLRSSASAYLDRTPATSGNRQIFTISFWFKRGLISTLDLFTGNNANGFLGAFRSDNTLYLYDAGAASGGMQIWSAQVFRDPSAWYHLVVAVDTTQATDTNRFKVYINGVQENTATWNVGAGASRYPSLNANFDWNNTNSHEIGYAANYGYFDGYLTEFNNISGQQLDASSFGETNPTTGVWSPKKYTGTYGTNGWYLNFSDNSAATAAAIGKDYSGNGNNWTPNNISVTAGVTYDSMLDVPTQWADGGNGRGNYATWNPIDHPTTFIAPTNGNLSQNCNTAAWTLCVPTFAIPDGSGLWQWELVQTGTANGANAIGVCLTTVQASVTGAPSSRAGCSGVDNVGTTFINGATSGSITYPTVGNTITCLYDATNRTLQVFDNGTSRGTITGLPAGDVRPFVSASSSNGSPTFVANFGQTPFSYNQGGKALNTLNLPAPTILKGNQYFDTLLWTSTATVKDVTGSSFQPDLVWVKSRSSSSANEGFHHLVDAVRGATRVLSSNSTDAEYWTGTNNSVQAFLPNGFTAGDADGLNGNAMVSWLWKEGPTQGFDIVTYTGDGTSPRNISHNLGVIPAMVIVKTISAVASWVVKHQNLSSNNNVFLESTAAQSSPSNGYIQNLTSSSTFGVVSGGGGVANVNANGTTYIAYCFAAVAGFSAFGSYTGNGSADGTFVFCGFRPRFVMVKRTDTSADWYIVDTARSTSGGNNVIDQKLYPNLSAAENGGSGETTSTNNFDILSNGFKCRTTNGNTNANGGTYIYVAFAEVPYKFALGR
jgi:hypothetical protein